MDPRSRLASKALGVAPGLEPHVAESDLEGIKVTDLFFLLLACVTEVLYSVIDLW